MQGKQDGSIALPGLFLLAYCDRQFIERGSDHIYKEQTPMQ
jgi:hypothetical protein